MSGKQKRKRYTVQMKLDLLLDTEVSADSLEDAIAQARQIGVRDIVEFDAGYNDGEIKVVGVFE